MENKIFMKSAQSFLWAKLSDDMLEQLPSSVQVVITTAMKEYAEQCCLNLQRRITENAKISQVMNFNSKGQHRGWNHRVDKDSILQVEVILP